MINDFNTEISIIGKKIKSDVRQVFALSSLDAASAAIGVRTAFSNKECFACIWACKMDRMVIQPQIVNQWTIGAIEISAHDCCDDGGIVKFRCFDHVETTEGISDRGIIRKLVVVVIVGKSEHPAAGAEKFIIYPRVIAAVAFAQYAMVVDFNTKHALVLCNNGRHLT